MTAREHIRRSLTPQGIAGAAIPLGFLLIAGTMILLGRETGGPAGDGRLGPAEAPFDASSSPLDPTEVRDPVLETERGGTVQNDRYDDRTGAVTPTPSGPEGRDDAVFFEE